MRLLFDKEQCPIMIFLSLIVKPGALHDVQSAPG